MNQIDKLWRTSVRAKIGDGMESLSIRRVSSNNGIVPTIIPPRKLEITAGSLFVQMMQWCSLKEKIL